jgi:hypothetical protein
MPGWLKGPIVEVQRLPKYSTKRYHDTNEAKLLLFFLTQEVHGTVTNYCTNFQNGCR